MDAGASLTLAALFGGVYWLTRPALKPAQLVDWKRKDPRAFGDDGGDWSKRPNVADNDGRLFINNKETTRYWHTPAEVSLRKALAGGGDEMYMAAPGRPVQMFR